MSKPNLYTVDVTVRGPTTSGQGYEVVDKGRFDIDLNEGFTEASCGILIALFLARMGDDPRWSRGSERLIGSARFPMLGGEWVHADRTGKLMEVHDS